MKCKVCGRKIDESTWCKICDKCLSSEPTMTLDNILVGLRTLSIFIDEVETEDKHYYKEIILNAIKVLNKRNKSCVIGEEVKKNEPKESN